MKKYIKLVDKISTFAGIFTGVVICIACGLIITEIILRTAFASTLYITEEYVGYLHSVLAFTGLSICLIHKSHIRMDFIDKAVRGKGKLIVDIVTYSVGAAFTLYLIYVTYNEFMDSVIYNTRSMQVSQTPLAIPQFFMPVGSVLLFLQFVAEILRSYLAFKGDTEIEIKPEATDLGR